MRWRKQVTAETLPELERAAERDFRPGTTYSIYSIREETPAGVVLSYRAEAHPPEPPGAHSPAGRPAGRRAGQPGTEFGQGAVRGRHTDSVRAGPDVGPVTGRIIDAPVDGAVHSAVDGAPGGGVSETGAGAGPGGSTGASVGLGAQVRGGGAVAGYNPATVDELPGWRPETIPAPVLAEGPSLGTAYALLKDPGPEQAPLPPFATEDPEFVSLLERAAPPEGAPGSADAVADSPIEAASPARTRAGSVPLADAWHGGPSTGGFASGSLTAAQQAQLIDGGAVVSPPQADADTECQGDHRRGTVESEITAAAEDESANETPHVSAATPTNRTPRVEALRDRRDAAAEGDIAAAVGSAAPSSPHPQDGLSGRTAVKSPLEGQGALPARPGRATVVYVGLLDDPVEAAERSGHRRWSAAGVLNGGQPGANVVCYGLGDGSNVARLAQGLHRYQPMRLVLAVDSSRKHADTQAWVRQVASVIQPSSLVSVARTLTTSPGTVQELGYPVQQLG